MIRIRSEGEEVKQGLNLYPFDDKFSKGFILKIGKLKWRWRYSTPRQQHLINLWVN